MATAAASAKAVNRAMTDARPDPDQLLARLKHEEAQARRGKLKIFFGASAGVGKTYAMLSSARALKAAGRRRGHRRRRDARPRRDRGAARRPRAPAARRRSTYRDRTLKEFDLDAALARKPALILVDELAHSNVPGLAPPQALAGRRGAARRRHRRLVDDERPAPREPERRRRRHHRHPRVGDGARPRVRRGRRGRDRRPAARRPAAAPEGRQGLPAAAGRPRPCATSSARAT